MTTTYPSVVWVAIWEDRHCEPTAHVFFSEKNAIEWARRKVRELAHHAGDIEEPQLTHGMRRLGWVYRGQYSCEGCGIWVVRTVPEDAT